MAVSTISLETNLVLDVLRRAVSCSRRAPSIYNTQPWRWVVTGRRLALYAEPARQLPVLDPEGRLLRLSCGAALQHARCVLAAEGWASSTALLPSPTDSTHLATVTLGVRGVPSERHRRLADAMLDRRTDRRPFTDAPVSRTELDRLGAAVRAEGAGLRVVATPAERVPVVFLLARADQALQDDPAYRAELAVWTSRPSAAADGVHRSAVPHLVEGLRHSDTVVRDFETGRPGGLPVAYGELEQPTLVVLTTDTDSAEDHLRAGGALGALLLQATVDGLAACPLGQVTDLPRFREALRQALGLPGQPQLMLQIGFGSGRPPPTTRRPLKNVLEVSADRGWRHRTQPAEQPPAPGV